MILRREWISMLTVLLTAALGLDALLLAWQLPVVIETYKYFRMCKTLIQMAEKA